MKKEDINTVDEKEKDGATANAVDNTDEAATKAEGVSEDTAKSAGNDSADDKKGQETDPLETAKAEIERLKTEALYKQAEFDNYRKRTKQREAELILNGGEKTITSILPVLDDFERALQDKSSDPGAIREGMNLIFKKFVGTLEKLGVKKIETEGADFNVDYHEAIAHVPGMGEDKKGKVIDCVQTGYTLNDKVIRYAKVAVGQ